MRMAFVLSFAFCVLSSGAQDLLVHFDDVAAGTTDGSINMGTISRTNGSAVAFSWSGTAGKVSVETGGMNAGFLRPVTVGSTSYTNAAFTKHLLCKADDTVSTPQRFTWTFAASRKASYGYFITISNFTGLGSFYGAGGLETGTDYQILSIVNDNPPFLQNEGLNSPYGENIAINNNLLIWVTGLWDSAQATAANRSRMYFYNATNMVLLGFSIDPDITQNATVNTFKYGIHDAHSKDAGTTYRLGPLVLFTNGTTFPVWPGGGLHAPTNFSPAGVTAALAASSAGHHIVLPATNATWTSGVTVSQDSRVIYGLGGSNRTVITADGGFTTFSLDGSFNTISNFQIKGDGTTDEADGFHQDGGFNTISHVYLRELLVGVYFNAPGLLHSSVIADCWRSHRVIFTSAFYDANYPQAWDSTNVACMEDNLYFWTSAKNQTGNQAFFSSQVGQAWNFRHNTVTLDASGVTAAPLFDYHGDSSGLSRPGVSAQLYSNRVVIGASDISGNKFVDLRGSRALVYSNFVTGATYDADKGVVLRKDSISGTTSWLVNNTYVFANKDGTTGTHDMAVTPENGLTDGVEFFTSAPAPLVALAYPHPARGVAAAEGSGTGTQVPAIVSPGAPRRFRAAVKSSRSPSGPWQVHTQLVDLVLTTADRSKFYMIELNLK